MEPKNQKILRKEYEYYNDYVKFITKDINMNASISIVAMSGSGYRLIEIITSKAHDIDAINIVASDLLFFLFNFAIKSEFEIEHIKKNSEYKSIESKVANLATAMKEIIFFHAMYANSTWLWKQELQTYAIDIANKTLEITNVENIHELLSISIQKKSWDDKIMVARFKHIIEKPFMKYDLECNTIYPLLYTTPEKINPFLLALLENSGIRRETKNMYLDETITKIQAYAFHFMKNEGMTLKKTNTFLNNILNGQHFNIDIQEKNTLIWPISHMLEQKSFEENWNNKYPGKIKLTEKSI
jgi:hypothetical protein